MYQKKHMSANKIAKRVKLLSLKEITRTTDL